MAEKNKHVEILPFRHDRKQTGAIYKIKLHNKSVAERKSLKAAKRRHGYQRHCGNTCPYR